MPCDDRTRNFELLALPHREAVHNLAAWLTGNMTDAEDVAQEVYLRAFRYFDAYQRGNYRLWLLTIVRNTFISWAKVKRTSRLAWMSHTRSERSGVPGCYRSFDRCVRSGWPAT
jgi:DNA-directed RNA polymerase specialized sigma24 family protein